MSRLAVFLGLISCVWLPLGWFQSAPVYENSRTIGP